MRKTNPREKHGQTTTLWWLNNNYRWWGLNSLNGISGGRMTVRPAVLTASGGSGHVSVSSILLYLYHSFFLSSSRSFPSSTSFSALFSLSVRCGTKWPTRVDVPLNGTLTLLSHFVLHLGEKNKTRTRNSMNYLLFDQDFNPTVQPHLESDYYWLCMLALKCTD